MEKKGVLKEKIRIMGHKKREKDRNKRWKRIKYRFKTEDRNRPNLKKFKSK